MSRPRGHTNVGKWTSRRSTHSLTLLRPSRLPPVDDNLAIAREVIVKAYSAGMRTCQIGLRIGVVQ